MTGLLTRLIEDQVRQEFKQKRYLPLKKFISLERASQLSGLPIEKLHDFIARSKTVHAVVYDHQFLIHPETFRKYLAARVKREAMHRADLQLKTRFLQKTEPSAKRRQSRSAHTPAEGEASTGELQLPTSPEKAK